MRNLPLLPVMGIGSAATPGWLFLFRDRLREGGLGPSDIEEAYADATRLAVADQIEAGFDVITDGELARMRFVYEMYDRLGGLERLPVARRLGVPGYDRAPRFRAGEVTASNGLGLVAEYRRLRDLCPARPLKVALPGPLTFAGAIEAADPPALLEQLTEIVDAEVAALLAAGADLVQLDEPGLANPPFGLTPEATVGWINAITRRDRERIAVHVCFGNNASRPYAARDFGRLMPALRKLDCALLLLEFANREMADLDLLPELAARSRVAAGVVDVKSFHVETAPEVAARIRRVLARVPKENLAITADCGFSAIPRGLALAKMQALTAGTRLVRQELAG